LKELESEIGVVFFKEICRSFWVV